MKTKYNQLCKEVIEHNHHYMIDDRPIISDDDYDTLVLEILTIEDEHPDWVTWKSPTQDPQLRIDNTTHTNIIRNTYQVTPCREYGEVNDVQEWMRSIQYKVHDSNLKFTATEMVNNDGYYIATYRYNKCIRVVRVGTALVSAVIPNKFKELPSLTNQKFNSFHVLGKMTGEMGDKFVAESTLSDHVELFNTHRDHCYLKKVGFDVAQHLLITDVRVLNRICKGGMWKIRVLNNYLANQLDTSKVNKKSSVVFLGEK